MRNVLYCIKEPTAENGLMGIPSVQNWVTYNFSIFVDVCYLKPFAASSQVPEEWGIEIQQVAWLALSNRCRRSMPNVLSPTSPSVLAHPPPTSHTHTHQHTFSPALYFCEEEGFSTVQSYRSLSIRQSPEKTPTMFFSSSLPRQCTQFLFICRKSRTETYPRNQGILKCDNKIRMCSLRNDSIL